MKTYILLIFFLNCLFSTGQIEINFNSEWMRSSIVKDEFLNNIDLKPLFNQVYFKGSDLDIRYTFIKKRKKLKGILGYSMDREAIGGYLFEEGSSLKEFYQTSTFFRIKTGICLSKIYQVAKYNFRSSATFSTDIFTRERKTYREGTSVLIFKNSIRSGFGYFFTTLNLTFQQSIQLNKSEKNPLWFNLNMRYIPWTEYTYNQHTFWFGAGLSLGFNGGE